MQVSVKKLPKSEIEIEGELPADIFEGYFAKSLKKLGENLEVAGFRKGKVPESVILSKIPEINILEEMAGLALNDYYPKILEENKIDAISRPEIAITKLARKNPLGFKIKTAVLPIIKLPDYKKIAKKTTPELPMRKKTLRCRKRMWKIPLWIFASPERRKNTCRKWPMSTKKEKNINMKNLKKKNYLSLMMNSCVP
jgi:hypothetical protein